MYFEQGIRREREAGFTLLEILVASVIFAILVGALSSLFWGAMRLRERTFEVVEGGIPNAYVVRLIERDLDHLLPPGGVLAGNLLAEMETEGDARKDTLEFYSASGILSEKTSWGDIQKITYYLVSPQDGPTDAGSDLVRAVTRNLLASTEEEPEEQRLLQNVTSLEFSYYDGEEWQDSWDSTTEEAVVPVAIKGRIQFAHRDDTDTVPTRPIEFISEILSKASEDLSEDLGEEAES